MKSLELVGLNGSIEKFRGKVKRVKLEIKRMSGAKVEI